MYLVTNSPKKEILVMQFSSSVHFDMFIFIFLNHKSQKLDLVRDSLLGFVFSKLSFTL